MIDRSENYTRYNSEDLAGLMEELSESNLPGIRNIRFTSVKYMSKIQSSHRRRRKAFNTGAVAFVKLGDTCLHIATLSKIAEVKQYQLEMMASPNHLPHSVVHEIVVQVASRFARYDVSVSSVMAVADDLAGKHSIRIENRIERGPAKTRKLTVDEKIKRLQSNSYYGEGGKLLGAPSGTRCGHRANSWLWHDRIRQANRYYDRELAAKMKHAGKLRELGVKVHAYETFPEFLRRHADEIENNSH